MEKAVWVIAHGSRNKHWVELVDHEIRKVKSDYPIVTSFLEKVEGRLINDGINQLQELRAKEVFVIPMFVSSGSTHIEETKSILFNHSNRLHFHFGSCMDDHFYVVQHMINQAMQLSVNPEEEALLLIAHGSDESIFHERWERILTSLVKQLKEQTDYALVHYATFLPHTIEKQLNQLNGLTTIVVPMFLSKGLFTDQKIPKAIEGYPVKYKGEAYLPSSWIAKWIESLIETFQSV
ncbi:sirohydrochlorin chelatase [Tepidibacillus decaturensis]|uniref:Cobalamin biosynthesis protein CbiX n=1 Tax=Tepidibacillus decaturensis TaxID=1413211 RepID=A0A135L126_9BACI|nr:CbiX/SirB N-terminal domain-containing protein [Tepidibacillus decaturensis]KXG42645.1 hypothetical protein U473_00230 [Tepidibacillus decaturensis]